MAKRRAYRKKSAKSAPRNRLHHTTSVGPGGEVARSVATGQPSVAIDVPRASMRRNPVRASSTARAGTSMLAWDSAEAQALASETGVAKRSSQSSRPLEGQSPRQDYKDSTSDEDSDESESSSDDDYSIDDETENDHDNNLTNKASRVSTEATDDNIDHDSDDDIDMEDLISVSTGPSYDDEPFWDESCFATPEPVTPPAGLAYGPEHSEDGATWEDDIDLEAPPPLDDIEKVIVNAYNEGPGQARDYDYLEEFLSEYIPESNDEIVSSGDDLAITNTTSPSESVLSQDADPSLFSPNSRVATLKDGDTLEVSLHPSVPAESDASVQDRTSSYHEDAVQHVSCVLPSNNLQAAVCPSKSIDGVAPAQPVTASTEEPSTTSKSALPPDTDPLLLSPGTRITRLQDGDAFEVSLPNAASGERTAGKQRIMPSYNNGVAQAVACASSSKHPEILLAPSSLDDDSTSSQPDVVSTPEPETPEPMVYPDTDPGLLLSPGTRVSTLKDGDTFEISLPTATSADGQRSTPSHNASVAQPVSGAAFLNSKAAASSDPNSLMAGSSGESAATEDTTTATPPVAAAARGQAPKRKATKSRGKANTKPVETAVASDSATVVASPSGGSPTEASSTATPPAAAAASGKAPKRKPAKPRGKVKTAQPETAAASNTTDAVAAGSSGESVHAEASAPATSLDTAEAHGNGNATDAKPNFKHIIPPKEWHRGFRILIVAILGWYCSRCHRCSVFYLYANGPSSKEVSNLTKVAPCSWHKDKIRPERVALEIPADLAWVKKSESPDNAAGVSAVADSAPHEANPDACQAEEEPVTPRVQDPVELELREDIELRGASTKYIAPVYCPRCHIFLETRSEAMDHLGQAPHDISTTGFKAGRSLRHCEFCIDEDAQANEQHDNTANDAEPVQKQKKQKGVVSERSALKRHEIDAHMKGPVRCRKCGKVLSNDNSMTRHRSESPTCGEDVEPAWIQLSPRKIMDLMTEEETRLWKDAVKRLQKKQAAVPSAAGPATKAETKSKVERPMDNGKGKGRAVDAELEATGKPPSRNSAIKKAGKEPVEKPLSKSGARSNNLKRKRVVDDDEEPPFDGKQDVSPVRKTQKRRRADGN